MVHVGSDLSRTRLDVHVMDEARAPLAVTTARRSQSDVGMPDGLPPIAFRWRGSLLRLAAHRAPSPASRNVDTCRISSLARRWRLEQHHRIVSAHRRVIPPDGRGSTSRMGRPARQVIITSSVPPTCASAPRTPVRAGAQRRPQACSGQTEEGPRTPKAPGQINKKWADSAATSGQAS